MQLGRAVDTCREEHSMLSQKIAFFRIQLMKRGCDNEPQLPVFKLVAFMYASNRGLHQIKPQQRIATLEFNRQCGRFAFKYAVARGQ